MATVQAPQITLYTDRRCPFAHRVMSVLEELKLPYKEETISLDHPREEWYLKDVNPRGLVPSIKYSDDTVKDQILTESAVITSFLTDLMPSSLLPQPLTETKNALLHARINFFVDTFQNKIASAQYAISRLEPGPEKVQKVTEWIEVLKKEIEPLLADANPYFGGSATLTLAEIYTAPFILRQLAAASTDDILPASTISQWDQLPNFGKWYKAATSHPSITAVWDKERFLELQSKRIQKLRAEAKSN